MTDYEDLAFKPELTWEELCEWACSKGGYVDIDGEAIIFSHLTFEKDGGIYVDDEVIESYGIKIIPCISSERTYAQMKTIIEALWG